MPRRRLQDRIEDLVTKAVATDAPRELDPVIQELRQRLHEHSERLRKLAADKLAPK
jgi:hypothetical protein